MRSLARKLKQVNHTLDHEAKRLLNFKKFDMHTNVGEVQRGIVNGQNRCGHLQKTFQILKD